MRADFAGIHPRDADVRESAGLLWIERGQDLYSVLSFKATRPAVFEVSQSRGLSFDADALMKRQCLGDGIVIGGGMRADLFEFPNVVILSLVRRHQGP